MYCHLFFEKMQAVTNHTPGFILQLLQLKQRQAFDDGLRELDACPGNRESGVTEMRREIKDYQRCVF